MKKMMIQFFLPIHKKLSRATHKKDDISLKIKFVKL